MILAALSLISSRRGLVVVLPALLFVASALPGRAIAEDAAVIWAEGEKPADSKVNRNEWFESVSAVDLSGGAQIANFSEPNQPEGWALYNVDIPAAGAYHFWLRGNPCSGIWYSIDGGKDTTFNAKEMAEQDKTNRRKKDYVRQVYERFNVANDGKNDARNMTWFNLGKLDLTKGKHTIRFSLGGKEGDKRFASIDCFVLTTGDFKPNNKYKPGEKPTDLVGFAEGATWAFAPARDKFSDEALFDMRSLNEKVAGEHGFIRLSPDGNDFVRGDGQPIRFWGGSDYVQRDAYKAKDQAPLEHHARFLAKRGVNIVRLHGAIYAKKEGSKIEDIDEKEVDEVYRLVGAMKKEGIYTIISPYWGSHAKPMKSWGLPETGNNTCSALVFFDPTMQKAYKAWLKRLYNDVNPYTGITLAKDPSVAMIQIQNEDSMLFFTMQSVKGQALLNLRKLYGQWLLKKYGTLDKAQQAWKGLKLADDDFANKLPGMYIVWEFTQAARNQKGAEVGREERLADQLEFMTRVMYDFNKEIGRYLREDLGCKQLVNAGNWRTADQMILDEAERWSYTANDVVGKNHYFGGLHEGINKGWQILPGHVFTSQSFTKDPIGAPLNLRQVVGHPFIVSESLWVPPMRWQAEAPLIVAAQSSLSGLDIFFWFATGEEEWAKPMNKWTFALPSTQGQFPGASLMFRKGYVKQAPAVVHEERTPESIWRRQLPLISEGGAYDPNRDTGEFPEGAPIKTAVDPLAYLVGRVEVAYVDKSPKSQTMDLSKYIDREKMIVRSATGEIVSDLERGLYQVNAPKAQGVAGFLGKAGAIRLANVTIDCQNEYASVLVVPLDDATIASSGKLLVQIGTVHRPTGWLERPMHVSHKKAEGDASRIVEVGTSPWQIEKNRGSITVGNKSITKAVALDANGMPNGELKVERTSEGVKIALPPDTLYVWLGK